MSFDPNRPPRQPYMQGGGGGPGGGGGMNIPPNQMRQPMYNPQQQQMPPQQMQQQQHFQNQQQQMPQGGPPPQGMGQGMIQPQQQFRLSRITPENFYQYFQKIPEHLKEKFNEFTTMEQKVAHLQRIYEAHVKRQQIQMRMNAQSGGGYPPQPQPPQQQQQRFIPPPVNTDVQGGFIPAGQDQKPPPIQQQQLQFPGPATQGQKRKGPSPGVTAAAPFPGPAPTAENPSTMPTGPSSQPPPPQPTQGLHQSQSQPSFNIQSSQPPPQNPPGAQDFKFGGGGGQQIKNEPQIPPPQQQQKQFSGGGPASQQQQQLQPPLIALSSSQSQPSLVNPNQPKFEFHNQPRPEMPHQQQQQQPQSMQQDFGLPPQQQQSQMIPQNQQGFNVPTSQPMGQQQSMNQQMQQQQQHSMNQQSQQMPPQQHLFQPPQQQQQLLQPRPPQQQQIGQPQQPQTFGQGPSPVVHSGVASIGRVPTPSNKSVMSGGNLSQEIINSKEYQETLSRLKQYRELCYRLLQRMKLESDSAVSGMQRTIEVIEGKRTVPIELMEKLMKNINSMHQRYDITNGLKKTVEIIKKTPTIDMSMLTPDPYEQYKYLRISAPKEYYKEADDARNDRQQQQYIKKRMKWFEENNFWNGSEPTPYPWKRSIRQYSSEKLQEINREFNEKIFAPFDEISKPYIPKDPNQNSNNKKVTFNAEVDVLIRVDAQPNDRREDVEYDEKESDESDSDVIVVEGDEEFEVADDEEEKPEYENLEHFHSINDGNYDQAYYDPNGELQYTAAQQQQQDEAEIEPKHEPEDSDVAPPPAKRIKIEETSPDQQQQQYPPYDYNYSGYPLQGPQIVNVPGPTQNFEFPAGENVEGDPETLEDMEVAQAFESYLQRQHQTSYYDPLAMNTQMVQNELYSNAIAMPNENYYQMPLMDPPAHEKADDPPPDCPYSCCAPYEVDSIMGKPALLPKAAAVELRKFRHRVDYENQPLSEHSPFYAIIINPTKANSKIKYPELRINIPQNYPLEAINFQIVKPSSIHGKVAKSFYEKLEKRMFERRLCGISLHTIGEVVSAFRYCVEIVHRKRDILDFSHMIV